VIDLYVTLTDVNFNLKKQVNLPIAGDGHERENAGCYRHVGDEIVECTVRRTERPMTARNGQVIKFKFALSLLKFKYISLIYYRIARVQL
jgi:hypothetical protein